MPTTITPADHTLATQLGLELIPDPAPPHKARRRTTWQVRDANGRSLGSLRVSPTGDLHATKLAVGVAFPEMTVADALRWITSTRLPTNGVPEPDPAHAQHDVEGLRLPSGWHARAISPDHVEIGAPVNHIHCYVTVDFAKRCFREGLCTIGPAVGEHGTSKYHGNGWKQALVTDAMQDLETAVGAPPVIASLSTDPAPTDPAPTLPQTLVLLALSRDEEPPVFPSITRGKLLGKRWITSSGRGRGEIGKRHHKVTPAGLSALKTSPHLAKAERILRRKTKLLAPQ